MTPRRDGDHS
jgi:hypothetical protein